MLMQVSPSAFASSEMPFFVNQTPTITDYESGLNDGYDTLDTQGMTGYFQYSITAAASSFVVTKTDDTNDGSCNSDCSLREAIQGANADPDASAITFGTPVFDIPRIITVGSSLPVLTTPVTINGSAAGVTVAGSSQMFTILDIRGASAVGLDSLTISGGREGIVISDTPTVTVTNSTVVGAGYIGIIQFGSASTLTVSNSTICNNVTYGLVSYTGSTTIILNSTISGHGFMGISHSNAVTLQNSLVVGNAVNFYTVPGGTMTLDPYSIVSDTAADAKLGPLQYNGGPTPTMALLEGSPAINAGNPGFNGTGKFDQRGAGFARVKQGRLDVGAFESDLLPPTPAPATQSGPNFVVNSIADTDDGACDVTGTRDGCTLREAIKAANADADISTITFDLPGAGPHTITLLTALAEVRRATNFHNSAAGAEAVTIARSSATGIPAFRLLYLSDGTRTGPAITLSNLTFSNGNTLNGGGAFANYGASVTVTNCTFTNNTAKYGGAIDNTGPLTLINCTVSGNSAFGVGRTYGGGAIDNYGNAAIFLFSCTFTNNTAPGVMGGGRDGIWLEDGSVTLRNTIVVGNGVQDIQIDTGSITSNGYNLVGTSNVAGSLNATGDQYGVANAKLGALADNGGLTQTHALLPDSPAIDTGNSSLTTDQRGFARPSGSAADIGAFELQQIATPTPTPTPALSISDVSKSEGNSGSNSFDFTVTLSTSSTQSVSVKFATANDTAIAGNNAPFDYTARTGTLTFAPGQTSRNLSVIVRGDGYSETDETFTLNLSTPTNATIDKAQGIGTILNDDGTSLPTISTSDVSIAEGNSGTKTMLFTFNLDKPSETTISLNFATQNGTATSGNTAPADYSSRSGVLSFAPGQTSRTVAVTIYGDTRVEANETFALNLSNASGATLGSASVTGTIQNDDQ